MLVAYTPKQIANAIAIWLVRLYLKLRHSLVYCANCGMEIPAEDVPEVARTGCPNCNQIDLELRHAG
jgi:Zn finger protein HypA/HybF involved in hydrogenase expression